MIFQLNKEIKNLARIPRIRLCDIGWNEEQFQKLLFENLEKVLQDEELLLIMQSRRWQEEPDLMAIDGNGDLYIFELKAGESREYNLLQVLRYGQIYGQHAYEQLNDIVLTFFPQDMSFSDALNNKVQANFEKDKINTKQHVIVITNGLDFKTRQSILY